MNVIPAWREGITGKDIVVTILDDGLETDHPDLERNYVSGKRNFIIRTQTPSSATFSLLISFLLYLQFALLLMMLKEYFSAHAIASRKR